jgi:hypothetical protein
LSGIGVPPPEIEVSPTSLSAELSAGQQAEQTLTVSNTGESDLHFGVQIAPLGAAASRGPLGKKSSKSEVRMVMPPIGPAGGRVRQEEGTRSRDLRDEYQGDYLRFGLTEYGEIMPFEYPLGVEQLACGSWISGFGLAYGTMGGDVYCTANYSQRYGLQPISYEEIQDDPTGVQVDVVLQTDDGVLEVTRSFLFRRAGKAVTIRTTVRNISGLPVTSVVLKEFTDWDIACDFYNTWDYDFSRNMVFASAGVFAATAGWQTPALMDLDGWDDRWGRETYVDFPSGPVSHFDGLALLHYELGGIGPGTQAEITQAYAAADDLVELQQVVDQAMQLWVTVEPAAGTVPAGGSADLTVTLDASDLEPGSYAASLFIHSNDPARPVVTVPISLTVLARSGEEPGSTLEPSAEFPADLVLERALPNPFRQESAVRLGLPREAAVLLGVHDLSGRAVRRLFEGRLPAGWHRLGWDGRDAGGREVPAGLYFYRLEAEGRIYTQRALRLR